MKVWWRKKIHTFPGILMQMCQSNCNDVFNCHTWKELFFSRITVCLMSNCDLAMSIPRRGGVNYFLTPRPPLTEDFLKKKGRRRRKNFGVTFFKNLMVFRKIFENLTVFSAFTTTKKVCRPPKKIWWRRMEGSSYISDILWHLFFRQRKTFWIS